MEGQQGVRLHAEARRFVEARQRLGSNWRARGTPKFRALRARILTVPDVFP
jgi:hypothetical protein